MDYKELIEDIVDILNTAENGDIGLTTIRSCIGDNFPELLESKDEKIRKAIVMFFEVQDDNATYSFISKKEILSWLERQKSPYEQDIRHKYLDELLAADNLYQMNDTMVEEAKSKAVNALKKLKISKLLEIDKDK